MNRKVIASTNQSFPPLRVFPKQTLKWDESVKQNESAKRNKSHKIPTTYIHFIQKSLEQQKQKNFPEAIAACSQVIDLLTLKESKSRIEEGLFIKLLMFRGYLYSEDREHFLAGKDFKAATQIDETAADYSSLQKLTKKLSKISGK